MIILLDIAKLTLNLTLWFTTNLNLMAVSRVNQKSFCPDELGHFEVNGVPTDDYS